MLETLYAILYVNPDDPEMTDVLQLCSTKEDAVISLLELAHYRKVGVDGVTQYHESSDCSSFSKLKKEVTENMRLEDVDIYRIVPLSAPNDAGVQHESLSVLS